MNLVPSLWPSLEVIKHLQKGGVFPDWNERAEWRLLKHRDLWQPLCRLLITANPFIKHSILHRWRPKQGGWGAAWHVRSSHMNSAGGNKLVGGNPIFTAHSFIHVLLHQWSCGARPSLWSMLLCVSEGCFATLCVCVGVCVWAFLWILLWETWIRTAEHTVMHGAVICLSVPTGSGPSIVFPFMLFTWQHKPGTNTI